MTTQMDLEIAARHGITQEAVAELKLAFSLFDKDGGGTITAKELYSVMKQMGMEVGEQEVTDMVEKIDEDQNGEIDFKEFVQLMYAKLNDPSLEENNMIAAFKVFDKDGNGLISASEMRHVLINLGENLTDDEIE